VSLTDVDRRSGLVSGMDPLTLGPEDSDDHKKVEQGKNAGGHCFKQGRNSGRARQPASFAAAVSGCGIINVPGLASAVTRPSSPAGWRLRILVWKVLSYN